MEPVPQRPHFKSALTAGVLAVQCPLIVDPVSIGQIPERSQGKQLTLGPQLALSSLPGPLLCTRRTVGGKAGKITQV